MSYEEIYGKVRLPPPVTAGTHLDIHGRHVPTGGAIVVHDADGTPFSLSYDGNHRSMNALHQQQPSSVAPDAVPALRSYAEWYREHTLTAEGEFTADADAATPSAYTLPLRAIATAEQFKQLSYEGGRKREADLWSLVEDVLVDAERSARYEPEVIGIASTQPQRRWYITHYAHIQDLLMRRPTLRRACIVCRWLERTYRDNQRQPTLRGDEDVVLRQLLLTYLRGGELHHAISAAVNCEDSSYSCVLSAAQLQTTKEPWCSRTALVPLFGEYAHGELALAWTGNEHRLDNLSQLYEDSLNYARPESGPRHGFDAVIGAALCGNLAVLEPAFSVNNNWRDMAWCTLRCALTVAFSKALMDAGVPVEGEAYRTFLERQTGSDDDWVLGFERRLVSTLTQRLTKSFLSSAPIEEQMQMRFILQALSPDDASWLDVEVPAPRAQGPDWGTEVRHYREAVRIFTHLLLVMDAAYNETLNQHAVQAYCGDALASAMAKYAGFLAELPRYPFDEGMMSMVAMAHRLRDYRHRATVYATFLLTARRYELERQTLSRERLEEQEAQLVRLFTKVDPDSNVRVEVQRLLNTQVPVGELLTHNKLAEQILWEAMHAVTLDAYLLVLRHGLEACAEFWLTQPTAELDAIADVSRILACRVVGVLTDFNNQRGAAANGETGASSDNVGDSTISVAFNADTSTQPPMTAEEASEATFWYRFSEARSMAQQHAKLAAELGAARAALSSDLQGLRTTTDRTLVFQLAQDEVAELRRLTETTQQAIRQGGAAVLRVPDTVSAILWLLSQLCENVVLSFMNSDVERDELALMQSVFALVEELDTAGYLNAELLPKACAADLYRNIRAVRVAYGQRVHRRHVAAALGKAQTATSGAESGSVAATTAEA